MLSAVPRLKTNNKGESKMRRHGLLALAMALTAANCGLEDLTKIDVTIKSTTEVEGASPLENLISQFGFGGFLDMDIANSQEFKNQGIKKEHIDSIQMRSLTLRITQPATGQDFTFLEHLEFYVEAEGQERKLAADGGPFEAGEKSISMTVKTLDLAPYATAPAMNLATEADGRRPGEDTTIEATVIFDVDVNLSGAVGVE